MNKIDVTKEEYLNAVSQGVKDAIHEFMETGNGYSGQIIRDLILESLKEGISSAMPLTSDVCDAIKDGIYISMPTEANIRDIIYSAHKDGASGR